MGAAPFRLGLSVLVCLGLPVALTSCGSRPQVCNCTSPPQQTFLIAAGETNSQSSQLLSFSIDATTGALGAPLSIAGPASPLTGAPLTALTTAGQGSPFVYVSPQSPNFPEQVYGYSINASTGALTEIASSPFAAEASIALNSGFALNNFLYLGAAAQFPDGLAAAIEAFSIGADRLSCTLGYGIAIPDYSARKWAPSLRTAVGLYGALSICPRVKRLSQRAGRRGGL
jgi:hypothetical protein